ncbi:hypothetical protein PFLUV_G00235170 [Perca fluviatilis]|uniref:Interferon alpha-inducible protein 27-like protein 2A n=2 Tax=Perca fluviatilis TaxID=8168 RepID=A0A6A5DR63_PERFL|nr:hypothetical protein PFLUV_G00235170 [Perca fluviatilis]
MDPKAAVAIGVGAGAGVVAAVGVPVVLGAIGAVPERRQNGCCVTRDRWSILCQCSGPGRGGCLRTEGHFNFSAVFQKKCGFSEQFVRPINKMGPAGTAAAIVGGAVVSVVGAPVVLGAIGFTSAGIAAGSYAAGMMSAAAVANGGAVAAGSTVAVLQAAGAAGLSGAATAAVVGAGAAVGWLTSFIR